MPDYFETEKEFEEALIDSLTSIQNQWETDILEYKTEKELIENWKNIIFDRNNTIDRLNGARLTDTEMEQIMVNFSLNPIPIKINEFINGKTVSITRDNINDKSHLGKEISLNIFDKYEIKSGRNRYQIARQPIYNSKMDLYKDRRGDLELLINGMPLIHIELKKSGVPLSKATNQIMEYSHERVFTGLFSLVQIFVAMTPEQTVYFANPGLDGKFDESYFFHWADFNNEVIDNWKKVAKELLSIPMAHYLIGTYTIPDDTDGILKVLRSYQYYAITQIVNKVRTWDGTSEKGGHIWHTTGSGKTMTSFKAAELISKTTDVDKVVFLIDRIELGTQSAIDYNNFAEATDKVLETKSTIDLINKLKDNDADSKLIVTSIQKLSNLDLDDEFIKLKKTDVEIVINKKIVFIVDECHRDTFGEMMAIIKNTFKKALFFGFTGTPIQDENQVKGNTTVDVFGTELHIYSLADGINDHNVLGFDPDPVFTFKDRDLRLAVALDKSNAKSEEEALNDDDKKKIYDKYMFDIKMAGYFDDNGKYIKGIEDYIKESRLYEKVVIDEKGDKHCEHREKVVEYINENYISLTRNKKFHSMFAVSSIEEAYYYYELIKRMIPDLKVSATFDSSDNYSGDMAFNKEEAIVSIVKDYNSMFNQKFDASNFNTAMKKDIQFRLAHIESYKRIENEPEKQLDMLIVVDQMLTGYNSKWLNTLFLDKMLKYQGLIQSFSRTNRLNGPDKKHGNIRYFRMPHTMKQNIEIAVKAYSGDRPFSIFVDKLGTNILNINSKFNEIQNLFTNNKILNFEKLPEDKFEIKKFVELFNNLTYYLESARIQGLNFKQSIYILEDPITKNKKEYELKLSENTYNILLSRYKEAYHKGRGGGGNTKDSDYNIKGYLTTIDTEDINADFMNSRYAKYKKVLKDGTKEDIEKVRDEFLKTFALLNQDKQKVAEVILHDIESLNINLDDSKTFTEIIDRYINEAKNDHIHKLSLDFGIDEKLLRNIMSKAIDEHDINEFGRFDELIKTIDIDKAVDFYSKLNNETISKKDANMKAVKFIKEFILTNGANYN